MSHLISQYLNAKEEIKKNNGEGKTIELTEKPLERIKEAIAIREELIKVMGPSNSLVLQQEIKNLQEKKEKSEKEKQHIEAAKLTESLAEKKEYTEEKGEHTLGKLISKIEENIENIKLTEEEISLIEALVKKHEEVEMNKGNQRAIDKYLFDKLNKIVNIKKLVYERMEEDEHTKPKVLKPSKELEKIDEDYFTFNEETDEEKLEKVKKLKQENTNILIDETISSDIQYIIYQAYKRYPELQGKKISFVGVDGFKIMSSKQHVMRSQVKPLSLIKELLRIADEADREYVIQINLLQREGVMVLSKLTQNARGGVMIHEIAHSKDYSDKSPLKMAKFLLGFALSPKRVREMERKTDETAIARGAGYNLYMFRREVHTQSSAKYVDYKKRTYLGPEEILYLILKHHTAYDQETLQKTLNHIKNKEF